MFVAPYRHWYFFFCLTATGEGFRWEDFLRLASNGGQRSIRDQKLPFPEEGEIDPLQVEVESKCTFRSLGGAGLQVHFASVMARTVCSLHIHERL